MLPNLGNDILMPGGRRKETLNYLGEGTSKRKDIPTHSGEGSSERKDIPTPSGEGTNYQSLWLCTFSRSRMDRPNRSTFLLLM